MTDELDWLPAGPESAVTTRTSKHRHVYDVDLLGGDPHSCRCGAIQDPGRSRRGKNNRARGLRIQREKLRSLGVENIPGNGPYDGRTEMFRAEHKSGGAFPKTLWRYLKGIPVTTETAILVVTDTPGPGHKARSIVVIDADDWRDLHGDKP